MIVWLSAALAAPLTDPEDAPAGFGVGVELGLPTGLTASYRPGGALWFAGGVGYAAETRTFALHADALFTLVDSPRDDFADLHLPFWAGFGPRVRIGEGTNDKNGSFTAVQAVFGFGLWHAGVPWEGFAEVSPGVGIIPTFRPVCDITVGVRYYPAGRKLPTTPAPAPTTPAPPTPPPQAPVPEPTTPT